MDIRPLTPELPPWWLRAERARREKAQRQRWEAARRLRNIEINARARRTAEPAPRDHLSGVLDSERLAAPFLERIGVRGRVQLLLWGGMTIVGFCTIVSFFTAPLMELSTALSVVLVTAMLILSYVM